MKYPNRPRQNLILDTLQRRRERARRIEELVRRDYLDDDADAADIAMAVIEENPEFSDETIAREVAQRIGQP